MTQEPEIDDIIMRGGAESPPLPRDEESDVGSTVSNPLEDSEYVHRCKASHSQTMNRAEHDSSSLATEHRLLYSTSRDAGAQDWCLTPARARVPEFLLG